ncbi:MAG: spermidine/putrescine transport system substrate-binding protein [Actinomycetota bacterium]|nr:spermidine/putrescine transport system substrate-binding protein [Actinomycetota bacterium]
MNRESFDKELNAALAQGGLSRRDVLRRAGAGAGAIGLSAILAACGVKGTSQSSSATDSSIWDTAKQTGEFTFANWPLYIDDKKVNGKHVHPSIEEFTKKTGIQVTYKEVINDNAPFFATIQPSLAAGKPTGYDLIVITNGATLDKLIRLDYLIPLDQTKLSNFHKYADPKYQDPSYDPGNKFTVPWQSGLTGIGYNPKLTGRKISSFEDLLDPAFKGKVGMFGDTLDMPNFALLAVGVNPEESTTADWRKAADWLTKQRDAGLVRQYYDQNYIKALTAGDTWLSMAWSGDIYQAQQSGSPDLQFVVPKEGGLIWTDNMCIPAHSEHPVDAMTWIDFPYQPKIAAAIADWVWYITPVPASKDIIAKELNDPTVANSPLVFPTPEMYASTHRYRVLTADEEQEWNGIFEPVYQS